VRRPGEKHRHMTFGGPTKAQVLADQDQIDNKRKSENRNPSYWVKVRRWEDLVKKNLRNHNKRRGKERDSNLVTKGRHSTPDRNH